MALTRRNVSSSFSRFSFSTFSKLFRNPFPFSFIHNQREVGNDDDPLLVEAICDCFRSSHGWDSLSARFSAVGFTDSIVQKVLLRLKQPENAKHALGFFHWSAKKSNHRHGMSSYSIAIHILVRARLLIDARALIESLLLKTSEDPSLRFSVVDALLDSYEISCSSPLVFDLLVQGYAKLRLVDLGFDVCRRLSDRGFALSVISFNTLIHVVQKSDRSDLVWMIYEHMIERRVYPNETTIKILISSLCKEGKLKNILDSIDRMQNKRSSPLVIVNTNLIFRIVEDGRIEEGLILLKRLLQKNMILDTIGYSLVVYAKVRSGDLISARKVFDEMLKRGFDANSFVYTAFIEGYCDTGEIQEAVNLMNEMENSGLTPYGETFNVLITGCTRHGRVKESLTYCSKMIDKGLSPSLSAFNEMTERLSEIEDAKRADEILTKLMDKGFVPDQQTYSNLINGFVKGNQIQQALKLYYEMRYRKISPGLQVFRSLILGLCQCGKAEESEKYLRVMKSESVQPAKDIYEALIACYERNGNETNAGRIRDEMVADGSKKPSNGRNKIRDQT